MKIFEQKYVLMLDNEPVTDVASAVSIEKPITPEKFVQTNLVFWPIREIDWGRAALHQRKYKVYRSVANGVTKLKINDSWRNTIIEINGEISINEQQSILCAIYPIHNQIDNFFSSSEHVYLYTKWSNTFEGKNIEVVPVVIKENPNYKIILDYLDWITHNKADALLAYQALFEAEKEELKYIIDQRKISAEAKNKWEELDWEIQDNQESLRLTAEEISNNIQNQINIINGVLENWLLNKTELDSLDYGTIRKLLLQSYNETLAKTGDFIEQRWELVITLGLLIETYNKRLVWDPTNFKRHEKLDQLINDMPKIVENMIAIEIWAFSEKIKTMWLDERLHWYKKLDDQKEKQVLLAGVIIEEEITKKWYILSYTDEWEIIVTWKDGNKIETKEINKILSEKWISKEHLKIFALTNIIKDIWLDIGKEWVDYEKVINSILNKHFPKKDVIFNDLFTQRDSSIKKLETKLAEEKNKPNNEFDLTAINELQFVLDYVKNQASYPVKVIEQAKVVWILERSWFDVKTVDWRENLMKAFSEWKWLSTLRKEILGLQGGMVWIVFAVALIFSLFKWWKFRTTMLSLLWIWLFGPALEEMAHKYWLEVPWLWKDSEESKLWNQLEAQRHFEGIDIKIPNLPPKYDTAYDNMYRANYEKPMSERIYEQDYAQIFGQLVTNKDFRELDLETIKNWLNNPNQNINDLLTWVTIPTVYVDWLITSKKGEKIADGRTIDDEKIKRFLILLVGQAEAWDKKLWDIFVKDQVVPDSYIYWEDTLNKEISDIILLLPLWKKLRIDIENIIEKTQSWTSADNLKAIIWDKARIDQLGWVITELEQLKTSYTRNDVEKIDEIIWKYTWLKNKKSTQLEIATFESKTRKDGWLRLLWVEVILKNWANSAIWWFATLVWTYWYIPEFIPNKFALTDISKIDTLIWDTNKSITDLDTKGLLPKDKKILEKRLNDLLIELKEKKLAMLKKLSEEWTDAEKTTAKTNSLLVLWDLMNTNSKDYLKWIEEKEKSMNELSKPHDNYADYIGALTLNYANIKILKEMILVEDSVFRVVDWNDLPWMEIKTKAKELLEKFEKDFIDNLTKTKWEIDKKITTFTEEIKNITLPTAKTKTEEYKNLRGTVLKKGYMVILRQKANEYVLKYIGLDNHQDTDFVNLIKVLELCINDLGWTFDWGSAGIVGTLDDTEKALNDKITELQENFPINPTLPSDVTNKQELDNFVNEIKELKKTVNWYEVIDWANAVKERKLEDIDDKIKEMIVLFKTKLNDLWDDYNEISKLNDLYIRTIWWNWVDAKNLDSSFVNLYTDKEEEIKEKIFQKMLEVKKFSELTDEQKRIIEIFIWNYKGKGDSLDEYLKIILIDNNTEIIIKPDLTINQIIQLINGLQQFTTAKSLVKDSASIDDTNRSNLQETADKLQSKIPWVLTWIKESIKWTMKWKLIELYNWMREQAS